MIRSFYLFEMAFNKIPQNFYLIDIYKKDLLNNTPFYKYFQKRSNGNLIPLSEEDITNLMEFRQLVKGLDISDLSILLLREKTYNKLYKISLPNELLKKAKTDFWNLETWNTEKEQWESLWIALNQIHFVVLTYPSEPFCNKAEFSDGIPYCLKGLGLGEKIYKTVLNETGWLTSNNQSSKDAQRVWSKLALDNLYYVIWNKTNIMVFLKTRLSNNIKLFDAIKLRFGSDYQTCEELHENEQWQYYKKLYNL
jgi:hypothetical protein